MARRGSTVAVMGRATLHSTLCQEILGAINRQTELLRSSADSHARHLLPGPSLGQT